MSNSITVTGNISEPDLRHTPSGKPVLNLSLADNHYTKAQDGSYQETGTSWYRLSLWDDHAINAAEALRKGDRVMVTGQALTRTYDDKQTGEKRESREIRVNDIAKVVSKRSAEQKQGGGFGGGAQPRNDDVWTGQPASSGGGWDTPGTGPAF